MSIIDGMELAQAPELTDEEMEAELLAEAKAWGFDSVDAWADAMDKAYDEMEADRLALQENLNRKEEWL